MGKKKNTNTFTPKKTRAQTKALKKSKAENKKATPQENKDLCQICETNCISNSINTSIECSECGFWYHGNCVSMNEREITLFELTDINFKCAYCQILTIKNKKILNKLLQAIINRNKSFPKNPPALNTTY